MTFGSCKFDDREIMDAYSLVNRNPLTYIATFI